LTEGDLVEAVQNALDHCAIGGRASARVSSVKLRDRCMTQRLSSRPNSCENGHWQAKRNLDQASDVPPIPAISVPIVPEDYEGYVVLKSIVKPDGALITIYGRDSSKLDKRSIVQNRSSCGNNNPIQCDWRNTAIVEVCKSLLADLRKNSLWRLSDSPRSICYNAGANNKCCVSWADKVPNLLQGYLVGGLVKAGITCAAGSNLFISARVANVRLANTCTTQCVSNRPEDCTNLHDPSSITSNVVEKAALAIPVIRALSYNGYIVLNSTLMPNDGLLTVYGSATPPNRTSTLRPFLEKRYPCGSNEPVECDLLENQANHDLCVLLLQDLTSNFKVPLGISPRSICRHSTGEPDCCASWAADTPGMVQGHLVNGLAKMLDRCTRKWYNVISARVGATILADRTCTTQCLSDRPTDCVDGHWQESTTIGNADNDPNLIPEENRGS
jgi:hypothetical protein